MMDQNAMPRLYDENPFFEHDGDSLDLSANIREIEKRKEEKAAAGQRKEKAEKEGKGKTRKGGDAVNSDSFIDVD